eukprot:688935-Rhodomonas_salina.1
MSVQGGQVLSGRGVGCAGVPWRDLRSGLQPDVGGGVLAVRRGVQLLARDPADHVLSAPTRTRSDGVHAVRSRVSLGKHAATRARRASGSGHPA